MAKKCLMLPIIVLFSACQLFLGPEPDTSPSEVLKSLWNDFNNIHANLEIRIKNNPNKNPNFNSWYDVYYNEPYGYALKISPNMTEDELFFMCGDMLKELYDPHVTLMANGKNVKSYVPPQEEFFSSAIVRSQLNNYGSLEYENFVYGTFTDNPGIGYIWIMSFINEDSETDDQEWGRKIDNIIDALANTKALILDVRRNSGGDGNIMEFIASRFASEHKDYMKSRTKTGPGQNDFSAARIFTVKSINKDSGNKGYTKPVALLTNNYTVSAAERFTMALKTQNHVTHIGTKTCGALSMRAIRSMINGWSYTISPERITEMNDEPVEGIGISPDPDKEIKNTTKDEQLEFAIKYLTDELAKLK